jgi:hypothetical protein
MKQGSKGAKARRQTSESAFDCCVRRRDCKQPGQRRTGKGEKKERWFFILF